MLKLNIIGLRSQRHAITESLKRTRAFELSRADSDSKEMSVRFDKDNRDALLSKLSRVKYAIDFIEKSMSDLKPGLKDNKKSAKKGKHKRIDKRLEKQKKPLFFCRKEIDYEEYVKVKSIENELLKSVSEIEAAGVRLHEIRVEESRIKSSVSALNPYKYFPMRFSDVADTLSSCFKLGLFPVKYIDRLSDTAFVSTALYEYFPSEKKSEVVLAILYHKSESEAAEKLLSDCGFINCPYDFESTAQERIEELNAKNEELYCERFRILIDASERTVLAEQLKTYYDFLTGEIETANAEDSLLQTKESFLMSGWIPGECEKDVAEALRKCSDNIVFSFVPVKEGDMPPTYLQNNRLVAPFESITNMFSAPAPGEKDPNTVMSFFFFLFFGIMVGDAGYGILLFVVTLAALFLFRMEKGMRSIVAVICIGSLSAIAWGAFFGGWFSLTKNTADGTSVSIMPGVINPVNDSLIFLGLCLGLGVIHLMTGIVLKMIKQFRQKDYLDGILDNAPILLIFLGGILFAATLLEGILADALPDFNIETIANVISIVSIVMLIAGFLGIVLFTGRKNKGILKKAMGGFGGLYGLINYVSDILSYSRLFGIGLAGGVIASVANQLGSLVMSIPGIPYITYPIGFIIAAVFHVFNLALGVLGAYVHNSRLQFVEFYGKFYDGGGRVFVPMGSKTRYITVRQNAKR